MTRGERVVVAGGILLVLAVGVVSLWLRPITDPTEGRYAAIARTMVERDEWITPRTLVDGRLEPYLGKPPLTFWAAAASIRVFGPTAWAVRLPSAIFTWMTILLTFWFARRWGERTGWIAALVASSMPLTFTVGHAVTIDAGLSFAVALSLVSFSRAADSRVAAYGVFVGFGLSMLTKGPIGIVLTMLPIVAWVVFHREYGRLRRLPWGVGLLVALGISVPWYWVAERAQPGFLSYFFYHEHVLRYLRSEYGDRYGRGHDYPYGSIVVMFALTVLPWSCFAVAITRTLWTDRDRWLRFAFAWGIAPLFVFAFARNITAAYALPACGGIAIVVARSITSPRGTPRGGFVWPIVVGIVLVVGTWPGVAERFERATIANAWYFGAIAGLGAIAIAIGVSRSKSAAVRTALLGSVAPLAVLVATLVLRPDLRVENSTEAVIARCQAIDPHAAITFIYRTPGSAEFYGGARLAPVPGERARRARPGPGPRLLVARRRHWDRLDPRRQSELAIVDEIGSWLIIGPRIQP